MAFRITSKKERKAVCYRCVQVDHIFGGVNVQSFSLSQNVNDLLLSYLLKFPKEKEIEETVIKGKKLFFLLKRMLAIYEH